MCGVKFSSLFSLYNLEESLTFVLFYNIDILVDDRQLFPNLDMSDCFLIIKFKLNIFGNSSTQVVVLSTYLFFPYFEIHNVSLPHYC